MKFQDFISPKTIEIDGKKFTVSKIPAVQAQEIYTQIMKETDGFGNLGFTMLSRDTIIKFLSFASVENEAGGQSELGLVSVIETHCANLSTLHDLIFAMLKENFGFLFDGHLQKQLEVLEQE